MIDRVGDRGRGSDIAQFADTFHPGRIHFVVLFRHQYHFELLDVGIHRYQIVRGVVALQSNGCTDTDLRPSLITVDTIGLDDRAQICGVDFENAVHARKGNDDAPVARNRPA